MGTTKAGKEPPLAPPQRRARVSPLSPILKSPTRTGMSTTSRMTPSAQGRRESGFSNNVRAIRLLKRLEAEDRLATPEEQEVLARYVGWGGLAECFDEHHSKYAS